MGLIGGSCLFQNQGNYYKAFIKPFEAPQSVNQLTGFYMRATLALNGLTKKFKHLDDIKCDKRCKSLTF